MQQLSMTGEDWKSDRQRFAERRAEAQREKAGLACAGKAQADVKFQ